MLIRATKTLSALTLRVMFYAGLFLLVVLAHVGVTTALRNAGWPGGLSLFASGAGLLACVLLAINFAGLIGEQRAAARERERQRLGLPGGPYCVIWREQGEVEPDMPWELAEPLRIVYPAPARRLGVEGLAVVEFEINAQGAAKNIELVDVWPSKVFFDVVREALAKARFQPKFDTHVRFGSSYRLPFVFRVDGGARASFRLGALRTHAPASSPFGESSLTP